MAEERVQRRLAAILAADIVGYSRMMEQDEAGTLASLKSLRRDLFEPKIKQHGGRIFKTTGDGAFVEFSSAVAAVQSAVDIQEALGLQNTGAPDANKFLLRIGVSLGDVIVEGTDLYGNGVNVAARMESLADAGGICISGNVHEHIRSAIDVRFEDLGEQSVKNIVNPIRVFRLAAGREETPNVNDLSQTLRSPDKPTIAILPFANRSREDQEGYLAEGIAEDVITKLSKLSGLFVIGGNSSAAYKDRSIDAREVGRELDVRYVVEGSVQRSGERARITVRLVDAKNDQNIWIERYDRNIVDIFDLQDEVASEVVKALELELEPAEADRLNVRKGGNIEAYNLYQQARASVNPPSRANTLAARRIFHSAVEIDPGFAAGLAGLSMSYARAVFFGHSDDPDTDISEAYKYSEKALSIDDTLGISHSAYSRACFADRKFDEAIKHSAHAIQVQPGDADSYGFHGFNLAYGGRASESPAAIQRAIELEPSFVRGPYFNMLGCALFAAHRYQDSHDAFELNIAKGGPPHTIVALAYWIATLIRLDRRKGAQEKASDLKNRFPNFAPQTWTFGSWYKYPEDAAHLITAIQETGMWD